MFLARKAYLLFTADHHFSFVRSGGDEMWNANRLVPESLFKLTLTRRAASALRLSPHC